MKKQTEKEQLKQRIKDLEDQNRFLRNENERLLKKNERLRIKEERRILAGELDEKEELSFFIKIFRESWGLTRAEMARRINVQPHVLLNYEKGKGYLSGMRDVAERIKKARKESAK